MSKTHVKGVAFSVHGSWQRELDESKQDMGLGVCLLDQHSSTTALAHNDNNASTMTYDAFLEAVGA